MIAAFKSFAVVIALSILWSFHAPVIADPASPVPVIDGVVQPRRPIMQAIADAMAFLKKADGGYVPGNIDGSCRAT